MLFVLYIFRSTLENHGNQLRGQLSSGKKKLGMFHFYPILFEIVRLFVLHSIWSCFFFISSQGITKGFCHTINWLPLQTPVCQWRAEPSTGPLNCFVFSIHLNPFPSFTKYVPAISGNSLQEQNHQDKELGKADSFNIKEDCPY